MFVVTVAVVALVVCFYFLGFCFVVTCVLFPTCGLRLLSVACALYVFRFVFANWGNCCCGCFCCPRCCNAFLVEVAGLLVFLDSSCYLLFVELVVLISCRLQSLLALTILICLLYRSCLLCPLRFSSAVIVSCCLFCASCCRSSLRSGCLADVGWPVGCLHTCSLVCLLACLIACLSVCLLAFACWKLDCLFVCLVVGFLSCGPAVCQSICRLVLRHFCFVCCLVFWFAFWSSLKERLLFVAFVAAPTINCRMSSSQSSNWC